MIQITKCLIFLIFYNSCQNLSGIYAGKILTQNEQKWEASSSFVQSHVHASHGEIGNRKGDFNGELNLLFLEIHYRKGLIPQLEGSIKIGTFVPLSWHYHGSLMKDTKSPNDIFTKVEVDDNSEYNSNLQKNYTLPYTIGGEARFPFTLNGMIDDSSLSMIGGVGCHRSAASFRRDSQWYDAVTYDLELPISFLYHGFENLNGHVYAGTKLTQRIFSVFPDNASVGISANSNPISLFIGMEHSSFVNTSINYTFTYFSTRFKFNSIDIAPRTQQHGLSILIKI